MQKNEYENYLIFKKLIGFHKNSQKQKSNFLYDRYSEIIKLKIQYIRKICLKCPRALPPSERCAKNVTEFQIF
ncbi:hypothetical protein LEP1GSC127_3512 [Leptospira kirschneri str. 200801925]|nr:hypothetical protein LEP1GSC127_3512 [Leptospira kirschneri str. 200801925]